MSFMFHPFPYADPHAVNTVSGKGYKPQKGVVGVARNLAALLKEGKNILDLEDFIVSQNLLPLGALYITIFCTNRMGWGEKNSLAEINTGDGPRLSKWVIPYMKYVLPVIIFGIWITGLITYFR